jgi:hypothetical protein
MTYEISVGSYGGNTGMLAAMVGIPFPHVAATGESP